MEESQHYCPWPTNHVCGHVTKYDFFLESPTSEVIGLMSSPEPWRVQPFLRHLICQVHWFDVNSMEQGWLASNSMLVKEIMN